MPTQIADVGADALREAKSNLDSDYVPSEDEEFMNERQQEYFRGLLLAWKKSILSESESTLAQLQDGPLREPYAVYLQGGLTFEHSLLALLGAAAEMNASGND